MDTFTLSAPLAPPDDVLLTSFYGNLVAALGRMTGGMLPDGYTLDVADDAMSLMCMQAIVSEAGMEHTVMGMSPSVNFDAAYVAMHDGSIWKFESVVTGGDMISVISKAEQDDCTDNCSACQPFYEAIKFVATKAIFDLGESDPTDQITGSVGVDVHAAICQRMKGTGKFIVRGEGGYIKNAYEFQIDAPPRIESEDAQSLIGLRKMDLDEIKAEEKNYKTMLGVGESLFPVKVGQA